jgi:hypothetical protein
MKTMNAPALSSVDGRDADQFERIDRYQTLSPGTYWRCHSALSELSYTSQHYSTVRGTVTAGEVLLLLNTRAFDNAAHTVELLEHPRDGGNGVYLCLVNDFLNAFEPAPDGEQVRQREVAEIHDRVADLQGELVDAQANPAVIDAYVAAEVKKLAETDPSFTESTRTDVTVARAAITPATFIAGRAGTEIAVSMQAIAKRQHAIANIKAKWLTERTGAIADTLSKLAPFFAETAQVALARTRGIRDYADELMKALTSLDLYIGKGVEVVTVCEGQGAADDDQLVLRQRKQFVDEELAAYADVDEMFDFSDLNVFDEKLASSAALRDQIFTFPRAVVSMAVRRNSVNYGDVFVNAQKNGINQATFLLVRNGDNVYRVYSSQPSHEQARRLFPTTNEANELFRGFDGEQIRFTDLGFSGRAGVADDVALSYKRLLILLCGLDHRLSLFGSFYPAADSLSFISLDFQAKYMRFVADDDESLLIAGGDRTAPVNEWFIEKNSALRSGSRVICYWKDLLTPETAPALRAIDNDRVHSKGEPVSEEGGSAVKIVYRDGQDLCVDVRSLRSSWTREPTSFNAKVVLTNVGKHSYYRTESKLSDRGLQAGFLCLDAVRADDIEQYVYSRVDRVDHIGYIRLFKRATAFLRAEEQRQRETREYLIASVEASPIFGDQAPGFARSAVLDAILTWRAANRGAELPGIDEKARLKGILDLVYRDAQSEGLRGRIEAFAAENGLQALRGAISGRNKAVLYRVATAMERNGYPAAFPWVKRVSLDVLKTKLSVASEKWVWLRKGVEDASEQVLFDSPKFADFLNEGAEPCTVRMFDEARRRAEIGFEKARRLFSPVEGGGLDEAHFKLLRTDLIKGSFGKGNFINVVNWAIPVGYCWISIGSSAVRLLQIVAAINAEGWLYAHASTRQRETFRTGYVDRFERTSGAWSRLTKAPQLTLGYLRLKDIGSDTVLPRPTGSVEGLQDGFPNVITRSVRLAAGLSPNDDTLLSDEQFLKAFTQSSFGDRLWLLPELFGPDGLSLKLLDDLRAAAADAARTVDSEDQP